MTRDHIAPRHHPQSPLEINGSPFRNLTVMAVAATMTETAMTETAMTETAKVIMMMTVKMMMVVEG